MTPAEQVAYAIAITRNHHVVLSYTAAGWTIGHPDTDPALTLPSADDDVYLPRVLKPCGSHAAFNRHRKRDEDPCLRCRDGERDYQARRHVHRRTQAAHPLLCTPEGSPMLISVRSEREDASIDELDVDSGSSHTTREGLSA